MQRKNRWDRQQILIAFLLCVTILALCTTVWALCFRRPQRVLMPDYAPVTLEANASPIPGDPDAGNRAESGSGSVSLGSGDSGYLNYVDNYVAQGKFHFESSDGWYRIVQD